MGCGVGEGYRERMGFGEEGGCGTTGVGGDGERGIGGEGGKKGGVAGGERCVRAWWSRLRGRENDVWMVGMITGADVGRKKGGRCGIREWWVCWGDGEWGGVGDRMMVGALKKGGVSEAERVGVVIGLESGRGLETTFIMGGGGRGWVSVGKKIGQVEGFVRGGVGGWSVGVISGKRGVLWSVNSKIYSGRALGTEDVGVKQGMEVLGYDKCHGRMVGYTIQHCFAMAVRLPVGLLMVLFVAVKVAYHCRRVCSSLCSIVRREGRGGVGCVQCWIFAMARL
ncbi:hypothetical protein Tco_1522670 [Tanacetum coccineum]